MGDVYVHYTTVKPFPPSPSHSHSAFLSTSFRMEYFFSVGLKRLQVTEDIIFVH